MPEAAPAALPAGTLPADSPVPKVSAAAASFVTSRADIAVCFAFESERPSPLGVPASSALAKALVRLMQSEGFRGKRREILVWQSGGRFASIRYLVVGLGDKSSASPESLREACGIAARRTVDLPSRRRGGKSMFLLPPFESTSREMLAEAATEGILLGAYRMTKYLTGDEGKPPRIATAVLLADRRDLKAVQSGISRGTVRASAANLARDLVNEPAGVLTPTRMAAVARHLAKQRGLEIRVLDKKELVKRGMGAILGVSAGSAQPPCMIHLIYRPSRAARRGSRRPRIALVGKGLTFDSGGLSLKTAAGMETMKLDKAGACAVLGAMSAIAQLKPDIEVHGVMGMTENMPGGAATKPGDVLRSLSGKTIEVLNTDAEGRVVLADALAYAQQQKVDEMIDLATLTGACMVALGPSVSGVFGNRQEMVDALLSAARSAGEPMWQLPLRDEYNEFLRSEVADVKNTPGSRYGGAITAGLFLRTFVSDEVGWVHLDIAGPAFMESERGYTRKGGTGAGVRTLITYVESLAARQG